MIASKTYHRQLGVGFDGSEELTNRLTAASVCGRLRAYVLYLDKQPVAFWIATAYDGTLYSDFMGYDPAFARYSPGMFLITRTLDNLCIDPIDCNIRRLDWGLGDAEYKQVIGDTEWDEANVKVFGPSAKGRAIELVAVPIARLDAWLKRLLANSGMLQKVKTNWRQRLVKKRSTATT
jgi:CelD/BcsL family acetyltransferase involved in cellulose biosynthesis